MSNWKDLLGKADGSTALPEAADEAAEPTTEFAPPPDPAEYRPWLLQRGRGRPALFLDLRWFEPRTGVLMGAQMSYPHLFSVDYLGDRMVSLDFGNRHYVIEGTGLGELPMWLQQGMVLAIQEHSKSVWPTEVSGPLVSRIVQAARSDAVPR